MKSERIRTRLFGTVQYSVNLQVPTHDTDLTAHAREAAPNWVHSMDAAFLVLTVNALPANLPVGTVHDCFLVRPGDAQHVYETARAELVDMYSKDPLQGFWSQQRRRFPVDEESPLPDPRMVEHCVSRTSSARSTS